jgi:hypothetical protein
MNQFLDNIPTPVVAVSLGPNPRALLVNRQFVRTFG